MGCLPHTLRLWLNFFSSMTADFDISSAFGWAIRTNGPLVESWQCFHFLIQLFRFLLTIGLNFVFDWQSWRRFITVSAISTCNIFRTCANIQCRINTFSFKFCTTPPSSGVRQVGEPINNDWDTNTALTLWILLVWVKISLKWSLAFSVDN